MIRTSGHDEEPDRKSKGISDSMKSVSESPREFRTRCRPSPQVQRNFGLVEERVRKSKEIQDSMKGKSESPLDWNRVRNSFELPNSRLEEVRTLQPCFITGAAALHTSHTLYRRFTSALQARRASAKSCCFQLVFEGLRCI